MPTTPGGVMAMADSHVKAALVGPSLTLPVAGGELLCGTWQQVELLELDVNAGRERTIICTVTGERDDHCTQ